MNQVRNLPVALDFDGVLAEQIWPEPGIGPAIRKNLKKARELINSGERVVIHTARPWSDQSQIEDWCHKRGLAIEAVVCGKFLSKCYIDDKAVNSESEVWL